MQQNIVIDSKWQHGTW